MRNYKGLRLYYSSLFSERQNYRISGGCTHYEANMKELILFEANCFSFPSSNKRERLTSYSSFSFWQCFQQSEPISEFRRKMISLRLFHSFPSYAFQEKGRALRNDKKSLWSVVFVANCKRLCLATKARSFRFSCFCCIFKLSIFR